MIWRHTSLYWVSPLPHAISPPSPGSFSLSPRVTGDVFVLRLPHCTRVIYTSALLPLSFSPLCLSFPIHSYLLVAPTHCPFISCVPLHTYSCKHTDTRKHTHTRREIALSQVGGERSLILSQGEWACWGIRLGLWVAQEMEGTEGWTGCENE